MAIEAELRKRGVNRPLEIIGAVLLIAPSVASSSSFYFLKALFLWDEDDDVIKPPGICDYLLGLVATLTHILALFVY